MCVSLFVLREYMPNVEGRLAVLGTTINLWHNLWHLYWKKLSCGINRSRYRVWFHFEYML